MDTPKIKTSNDYKIAIKARYEEVKNDIYSGSLLEPTPALLKQLCILKLEYTGKFDLEVFDRFFALKNGENKIRQIENFDTDRFRPLCNFLKGKTKSIQHLSLEVIAVLVDFEARPLNVYLKSSYEKNTFPKKPETIILKAPQYKTEVSDGIPDDTILKKTPRKKQLTLLLLATLYIAFISFLMSFINYSPDTIEYPKEDKEYTMRIDYHFKTVKNGEDVKDDTEVDFLPIDRQLIIEAKEPESDISPFYTKNSPTDFWYPDSVYNDANTVIDTPSFDPDTLYSFKIAKEIMENQVIRKRILQHINDYQIVNVEVEIGVSYIRM